ncbi:hypothetical protein [Salisediminibacterium halotolerans]|uniref:Uncharacterized protein n=1 Tax=Salisediminibacterium halotolerans TaxID=517425 RepID=A0A1H9WHE4_9BACI|nr:hypothetical protein [Salisediminibacterium haloalkalitolerans]SES33320.1 hypothetical protein SAMN05444126_13525 [Salisediminibacterium haloalkalitolerans]
MQKELYYVIWNSGTHISLQKQLTDPQQIHYAVEVDDYEKKKLQEKIAEVSDGDVIPEHVFVSPFDETKGDIDKMELGEDEDNLFHMIYNVGTERTKERLLSLYNQ